MGERGRLLREVMLETGTTQSALARMSGVHQPSISKLLSDQIDSSDDQLDRLLACMGFRVQVVRRPVAVQLNRSEQRSWRLHREVSARLNSSSLSEWRERIEANLERLRSTVQGEPHDQNVNRWQKLIADADVGGLHRVLTGLDRDSIEMREVSPMSGLLSESERLAVVRGR